MSRDPRVWLDGDVVPAGTWVLVVEEEDPEEAVMQVGAYADTMNGDSGPLIELVLPDEETAEKLVAAERKRRG